MIIYSGISTVNFKIDSLTLACKQLGAIAGAGTVFKLRTRVVALGVLYFANWHKQLELEDETSQWHSRFTLPYVGGTLW